MFISAQHRERAAKVQEEEEGDDRGAQALTFTHLFYCHTGSWQQH